MWVCPAFQRPERLAELALSWERCEPGRELYVRVWKDDPRKEEYFSYEWPTGWQLYESPAEWCGEALQEFYHLNPKAETYGFIGEDVVLRTPGGLGRLEAMAEPWYIAYPNDLLRRNRASAHICMGGKLATKLGWFSHPSFKHNYLDIVWYNVGLNTGTLRYMPDVIFDHQHPYREVVEMDDVYLKGMNTETEGLGQWMAYRDQQLAKDVVKVVAAIHREYEDNEEWEFQDGLVRSNIA